MKKMVVGLLLLLWVELTPVFACVPSTENPAMTSTPAPTIEDYEQTAPVIFVGRATREFDSGNYWSRHYEIRVDRYLKGDGYNTVILHNYHDFCGYGLSLDYELIFFVQPYETGEALPSYSYIKALPLQYEAQISPTSGDYNTPQPLPIDIQLTRIAKSGNLNWLYIPLSILTALLGIVIIALSLRRNRRKSKAKREELS